jgi:hypothetical protein
LDIGELIDEFARGAILAGIGCGNGLELPHSA